MPPVPRVQILPQMTVLRAPQTMALQLQVLELSLLLVFLVMPPVARVQELLQPIA